MSLDFGAVVGVEGRLHSLRPQGLVSPPLQVVLLPDDPVSTLPCGFALRQVRLDRWALLLLLL